MTLCFTHALLPTTTALVNDAIAKGEIPVLTSLGIRPAQGGCDDGTLNINADVAARDLAIALQPLRVCFISAGGGWKEDGVVIDELDMAADFERMVGVLERARIEVKQLSPFNPPPPPPTPPPSHPCRLTATTRGGRGRC